MTRGYDHELLAHGSVLLSGAEIAFCIASRQGTLEPDNRSRMRKNKLAIREVARLVEDKLKRMERAAK